MATAYATLAASGKRCDPNFIVSAADGNGKPMPVTNKQSCNQVMDARVADQVTGVLEGVITQGTGNPNASIGRVAAGKTGTTDEFVSAWFVGYTRELASAVAIGDPRSPNEHPLKNRSVGGRYYGEMFGGDLPAQTWSRMMRNALSGVSAASMPPAVAGQGFRGTGQISGTSGTSGTTGTTGTSGTSGTTGTSGTSGRTARTRSGRTSGTSGFGTSGTGGQFGGTGR
jgi:membrane peptidoglycan carboxypeptidase